MRYFIYFLLFLTSCFYYQHHIKQANYAYCHTDNSITYKIDNVLEVKQISVNPPITELTYNDYSKEQFIGGSCYIPKIEAY